MSLQETSRPSAFSVPETAPERRAPGSGSGRPIAVWAIGETRTMSERERRLTAAVYARIPGVLEHVRTEGRLPRKIPASGGELGLPLLVQRRGLDLELSEAERAVYGAIGGGDDAPAGRAVLIDSRGCT